MIVCSWKISALTGCGKSLLFDVTKSIQLSHLLRMLSSDHRISKYQSWKGPRKITKSNSWPFTAPSSRITLCAWQDYPNTSRTLSGLVLRLLPWGAVPVLKHPLNKEGFPSIQPKLLLAKLQAIPQVLVTTSKFFLSIYMYAHNSSVIKVNLVKSERWNRLQ